MAKPLIVLIITFFLLPLQAAQFEEGKHYKTMEGKALAPQAELVEFFSYSCPHCYHAEPLVQDLKKHLSKDVAFQQVPVGFFKPIFELTRIGAIVVETLGKKDELHSKIFERIHGKGGSHFRSEEELKAFFAENGISEEEYKRAFASEKAQALHKKYRQETHSSQISGVPSFIVRNKYLVIHNSVKDGKELAELIQYLAFKDNQQDKK
ncbi:MAG: thiol:disulfide interchange protein DsbA/DsbL [Pseudomonadota bacterium]